MAQISWNDSLSVNVKEIDEQHKKLIGLLSDLNEAMRSGKGKDVLGKILAGLIEYTASHFKQEERYFEKFGYPDKANHKNEHAAFVKKATEFKVGFDNNSLPLTVDVLNFMGDWVKNHIKGTDKRYSKFFNDKGLR